MSGEAGDAAIISYWTWDEWSIAERLAVGLARTRRVLYVDRPLGLGSRPPARTGVVASGIARLAPRVLSLRLARLPAVRRLVARSVARQIRAAVEQFAPDEPTFFVHATPLPEILDHLPGRSVLLVMDWTPAPGRRVELELAARVDLILAIPSSAYRRYQALYPENTFSIPTSCDVEQIEAAAGASTPVELEAIPGACVLYGGFAGAAVNATLFRRVADARPDLSFVVLGGTSHRALADAPNITIVPRVERELVPSYLAAAAVAFLPYDLGNEQAQHGVPLKLYEAFALGLPVVSTPLIELSQLGELVWLGGDLPELLEALERALEERPDSPLREKRRQLARRHSLAAMTEAVEEIVWPTRAAEVSGTMHAAAAT